MHMTAPHILVDPLRAFIAGGFVAGTKHPIPLVATRFDVDISHGLAMVSARRTFRNTEATSIEATITFPVPVHAVLFALQARIGGRTLNARTQRKVAARETYENAIERGKTAVLHEEVLRGVHMLSIGHIPPGEEIEVSATWAMTLTNVNGSARLRIPLTVGDIYGRSGLPDSDDLRSGGPMQMGELAVTCRDGQVQLGGGRLDSGKASIPLNAPIDLEVSGWTPADLRGRAADGREVVLRIEPTPPGNGALDVAVVIDHSGSMGEICSVEQPRLTKHRAIGLGLENAARSLGSVDVIDLWEFDDGFNHVGTAQGGQSLPALVRRLTAPRGGTEIGRALAGVTTHAKARDVLLLGGDRR